MRFLVRQRRGKRETREKGILEKRSLLCAKPSLSSEPGVIEGKRELVSPPEGQNDTAAEQPQSRGLVRADAGAACMICFSHQYLQPRTLDSVSSRALAETPDHVRGNCSGFFLSMPASPFRRRC